MVVLADEIEPKSPPIANKYDALSVGRTSESVRPRREELIGLLMVNGNGRFWEPLSVPIAQYAMLAPSLLVTVTSQRFDTGRAGSVVEIKVDKENMTTKLKLVTVGGVPRLEQSRRTVELLKLLPIIDRVVVVSDPAATAVFGTMELISGSAALVTASAPGKNPTLLSPFVTMRVYLPTGRPTGITAVRPLEEARTTARRVNGKAVVVEFDGPTSTAFTGSTTLAPLTVILMGELKIEKKILCVSYEEK